MSLFRATALAAVALGVGLHPADGFNGRQKRASTDPAGYFETPKPLSKRAKRRLRGKLKEQSHAAR